ncbi:MAG: glycosyltransferase family 39 protein [Verrucomicrobiales bacterium]|nr:glycosyltransferase family 39 protein [Verrucomicrobiales bacterium]
MKLIVKLLSGWDTASKLWGITLLVMLIAQITLMISIGEKGRDAIETRLSRTHEKLAKDGTVFDDEAQRSRKIVRSIKQAEFVSTGLWYGAAVGGGIVLLLLFSIKWWSLKIEPIAPSISFPPRRTLYWILGIAVIGLTVRLPRMDLSLYNDESFNFTRFIHGQFKDDKITGEPSYKANSWKKTIWGNIQGNNGVFYSILARVCHDSWQKLVGAADGEVGESALRLPSLLAGTASIVVIGLLAYIWGGARMALIAAWLTTLHPWHLRYSTEARPHGLVILFASILLLTLILAVREGRWRWWIGFGLTQFLCLWAYIASVYFLVPLNLAVLVWMLMTKRDRIPRWLFVNALGAVLYLQLAAPALPQIASALSSAGFKGYTSLRNVIEILAYLVSGMPLVDSVPENPWSPAWQNIGVTGEVLFYLMAAVLLFGLLRVLLSKNAKAIFISVVGVSSVAFTIAMSNLNESILHHWYVIYALPVFILIMAATVESLWSSRIRMFRVAGPFLLVGMMASFGYPFIAYSRQSKEQLRPIMMTIRGDVYPFDSESARPLVAAFWSDTIYDPTLTHTPSIAEVDKAIAQAERENRPFFIEFGYRPFSLHVKNGLVPYIEDSGKFELIETFYGLEETQFTHYLYRLKNQDGGQKAVK